MDKDRLDKTKKNIGVTKLDEQTRKELFEKFVDSGGKVIDEKTARRRLTIDRERQRELLKKAESDAGRIKKKEVRTRPEQQEQKGVPAREGSSQDSISSLALFFNRLKLRIKLKTSGVAVFNGHYFNNKFFKKFNGTYKPALMGLQIIYLEIFRKNPSLGRDVTSKLDAIKPIFYELIEMTGNLFDKIMTDQIVEQFVNFPEVPKKTSELRGQILLLYKKLHVLGRYEHSIQSAFDTAVDIFQKTGEKPSESFSAMRRSLRGNVSAVFQKLYPRLHLLFCLYQWMYIPEYDQSIDAILGVSEEDRPGHRQLARYFDEEASLGTVQEKTGTEEGGGEADNGAGDKAARKGLELMSTIDFSRLKKECDKARIFENVGDGDKVFLTFLLFNEFDREYSFILTTNKIKFRTDFIARTKIDFRTRLNDLYDRMKKSSDGLREYSEELENYEKARREKPSRNSQYIEFTKRIETFHKKKTAAGRNALAMVRQYMVEVAQELRLLLEDMDDNQFYIENPQEELVFDTLIEGEKKLNGKKIFEAIYLVYCYALAFAYRLGQDGDLSGDLEFKKEELDELKKRTEEHAASVREQEEQERQKSVLEELDDMI